MRIVKFIVSGGLAALLEFLVFLLLSQVINIEILIISQTISFIAGFIVSFSLNRNWVFKSTGKFSPDLLKYLILLAINLVLTNIILAIMVNNLEIVEWLAKLIVMGMVAVWNYMILQKLIFSTKK